MQIFNSLDFMNQEWVEFGSILINKNGIMYSKITKKIINGRVGNHGYKYVTIESRHWLVHRIMAICFLVGLPKEQVNHKNGNKLDNSVFNLEWATRSENVRHAYLNIPRKRKKTPELQCLTVRTMTAVSSEYNEQLLRKYGPVFYNWKTRGMNQIPFVMSKEINGEKNESRINNC